MKSNAILGFFTLLVLSASLTAHSSDFTEGFKKGYVKNFIESCTAENKYSQVLRDLCVCTATLSAEQLTVAEVTGLLVDQKPLEKFVRKCRFLLLPEALPAE